MDRSIEEMQANIANAKAALDAGEFDDDPDVRKEVQRILHFADQIDRRRTAALAEQEPIAEPEYIAADAMAEPDPVAEPDTVSGETPASEPEYAASDPVADVEPRTGPGTGVRRRRRDGGTRTRTGPGAGVHRRRRYGGN